MRDDVGTKHSSLSRLTTARLAACAALAAALTAGAARGTEVTLELESVTVGCIPCTGWYCGYYYYGPEYCQGGEVPVHAALAPEHPAGAGTVDVDTAGILIGGSLSLEAHAQDGAPVPAWTRPLERRDRELKAGFLGLDDGWADAELTLDGFVTQSQFSGTIVDRSIRATESGEKLVVETYRFSTLPGATASVCPGARLYFDEDLDGEEDTRDGARRGQTDVRFGGLVDGAGRTIADFCALSPSLKRLCIRRDFLNDQPLRRNPLDCRWVGPVTSPSCWAARVTGPLAPPPPFSGPTCQGLPLFSDVDGDGEGDLRDRCAATPGGATIDEHGCSAAQFCALQPLKTCRRADFANDEHGVKRPRDCLRTAGQCTASATAAASGAGHWDY